MKKHYETHVEDTDKLISVAGPELDYKSWYEQYRKLMEEQAQRKYGLYTPTSEGDDDFPSISGITARYSALGLTNEQMAENPVWKDLTGNGHDLQMKNFAWKGMSGVNGYKFDFLLNEWVINNNQVSEKYSYKIVINNKENSVQLYNRINLGHIKITLKITGIEINKSTFRVYDNAGTEHKQDYTKDGIYEIDYTANEGANIIYFYVFGGNMGQLENPITIEQLPLYPGALVFDGVDDYGTCDNFPILTKEKGYTVVALRQWISMGEGVSGLVSNVKNWFNDGAFVLEYNSNNATNKFVNRPVSFGKVNIEMDLPNNFTYQTSKSYKGVPITTDSFKGTNSLFVGKLNNIIGNYSNVAIWELVFLDHDATEEELTKIKDYFVKTYPWLFFDQAWTVVGKTNEDKDRATIANITGNGNDLVLSNVAFSENSGYGSYPFGMNVWNPDYIADQPYGTVHYPNDSKSYATTVKNNATNFRIKFRLRGLSEGGSFLIRVFDMNDLNTVLKTYTYTENGIHEFVYNDPNKPARIILYNGNTISNISEFYLDIIPEYEGYLVTDGVDDRVQDSSFKLNKDWTLVGEWVFLNQKATNAGITKPFSFVVYNRTTGLSLFINTGTSGITIENVKSIKAICSDGRIYLDDWSEMLISKDQDITSSTSVLSIGFNGTAYTQMAFKNLGIYNNQILSKDDCIKAYNYLQTLKAK